MDWVNSNGNQPLNDNFCPLLTRHVKTILESGLLLDEDYEVLLKASNFKIYSAKPTKIPLGLIASALTTLGSVFVAKRYDLPFVVFPPLTVTIGLLYLGRYSAIQYRRRKEIVNCLVESLIKIRKQNASIIHYTKLRNELSSTKERENLLYNQNFEVFVKIFLEKYRQYFKTCLRNLESLVALTEELFNDFDSFKRMDIDSILSSDYSSITEYFNITCKVQDVYVFLSSKFLNYLALTLCKNLANPNVSELQFLLDKKLAGINGILNKLYDEVQSEFSNARYGTSQKIEIDTKNKRSFNRHVSGKLQQTLVSAVNNLSIITEKLRGVLGRIESVECVDDTEDLLTALSDLRDHTFATYESLDVLCKLYGIFSEATKPQGEVRAVSKQQKENDSIPVTEMLSHDDMINVMEENYELFIPKNEIPNVTEDLEPYNDKSGVYLNLMLKELRQSLKEHERFKAARDKRGIKDEEEEIDCNKDTRKKESIKFDLEALKIKEENKKEVENVDLPLPAPRLSKLPPPPPPPPPSFNLSNNLNEDADDNRINKRSLFDNIRTLSSQLQREEEVFGNKDISSDSD